MFFVSELLNQPHAQRQCIHTLYTKVYSDAPLTAQEHQLLNRLRSMSLIEDCEEMLHYIDHALQMQPELCGMAS